MDSHSDTRESNSISHFPIKAKDFLKNVMKVCIFSHFLEMKFGKVVIRQRLIITERTTFTGKCYLILYHFSNNVYKFHEFKHKN